MGACHCSNGKEGLPQPIQTMTGLTLLGDRLADVKVGQLAVPKVPAAVPAQGGGEAEADESVEKAVSPKHDMQTDAPDNQTDPADAEGGDAQTTNPANEEAPVESVAEKVEDVVQAQPKPDFTGEWKMVRYEGDFETWMKEAGVGWASRMAASAAGFGVNGTFASIQQSETQITIKSKSIKGTTLQELRLDSGDQDDADVVSSKPIKVSVRWEEEKGTTILVVEAPAAKNKAGSVSVPLTRRYLEGDGMIAERTNCSGTVVRLFFVREG